MIALGALLWQTAASAPAKLWVLAAMVGAAVAVEGSYRLARGEIRLHEPPARGQG